MEVLVYGAVQAATLLLIAAGFSLVYGTSRVPNFAHGAVYVYTGFVAWLLLRHVGLPYPAAALLAVLAAALLGLLIQGLVLRRIRGMEMSEVIGTYAIGLVILESLRWAGLRGTTYTLPVFHEGVVDVLGTPLDHQRIAVIVSAAGLVAFLWVATRFSRTGRALRAVAQDDRAAMMVGIDPDRIAALAMALGCALSGLAAVVLLPLGSVVVEEGYRVFIYAIAVCVVGGLGSWAGTVLAALVLGFAQHLTVAYGKPHYQMVVMLVAIVLTLILRPSGLFGRQKELEERV